MRTDKQVLLASATLLVATAWGSAAMAQQPGGAPVQAGASNFERDRSVSVMQRPRKGFEALGLRLGSFMLWPKATTVVEHSDNIFGSSLAKFDDVTVSVQPEVSLTSSWSRHAFGAYARANVTRYQDFSSEDTDQWAVGVDGRLDILRKATVSGSMDFRRMAEPRTSSNSPIAAASPIEYDMFKAEVVGVREFNRLKISGRVSLTDFDYDDGRTPGGLVIQQDDRDRTQFIGSARADYALTPDTAFFVEVSANKRDYDLSPPTVLASRDSKGVEVVVGANFELTALVRGEVGVSYVDQNYEDPTFGDVDGVGVRGKVEWFPTELTTVTFDAAQTVEDSAITGNSGSLVRSGGIKVDHELLRELILSGEVRVSDEDQKGAVARSDDRVSARLAGTYLVNRNLGLVLSYDFMKQDSNIPFASYEQNRVALALTLQF